MNRTTIAGAALAVALVCTSNPARSEPVPIIETLSLSAAVQHTLDQYPGILAARAQSDAADAAVGQAKSAWWPTLTLTGGATRYEKPMVVAPIHGLALGGFPDFDRTLFQAGAHLNFTLFDGFERGARIGQAQSAVAAAASSTQSAVQAAISRTVSSYLDVLTRNEMLRAHDARLTALESESNRVQRLLEAGKAADIDLLRIEAVHAAATADRVRLAEALGVAERELARITNLSPIQTQAANLRPLIFTPTELPARGFMEASVTRHNPGLGAARLQTAAAQSAAQVAHAAHWPRVKLTASYLDFGSPDFDHTQEWNAGVQLVYPIFTGGATSKAASKADAALRASTANQRLVELNVSRQLDIAIAAVHESEARVQSLKRAVSRFAEVVRIEKLRLHTGTGTQSDYLDAEAGLLSARAALAEVRHAQIRARIEITRITGQLSLPMLSQIVEHKP